MKLRWTLLEMRNITTLTMLRGQIVHRVIANTLECVRAGQSVAVSDVKRNLTAIIREKYQESIKRLWHIDNRPPGRKVSEFTNLLEHYYRFPNINERAKDAQQVGFKCLENLMSSDLWSEILHSDQYDWREIDSEGFPSFDLDGIKVYVAPDFAYKDGVNTIIDWKTGRATEQDRSQLILYTLYAEHQWGWDPLDTRLIAAYLHPEFYTESWTPTQADLDQVTEDVRRSFNEMMALEPAYGLASADDFPIADDPSNCTWCRFQGICDGAKRQGVSLLAS